MFYRKNLENSILVNDFFSDKKMLELGVYSYGPLPEKVSEITP